MKLGAENRKKAIVAGVLAILAALAFARMMSSFGDGGGPSAPASNTAARNEAIAAATQSASTTTGTARTNRPRSRSQREHRGPTVAQSLDPRLNLALLQQSEKVTYSGSGRNIFKMEEEAPIPTPVAPALLAQQTKPPRWTPPMPAGPPPIPLKFYGWASKPGETRSVFLSANGSDIFVAREGEIIDRRYKIVRIQPNTVEVEDVLTNNRQNLPLTQG